MTKRSVQRKIPAEKYCSLRTTASPLKKKTVNFTERTCWTYFSFKMNVIEIIPLTLSNIEVTVYLQGRILESSIWRNCCSILEDSMALNNYDAKIIAVIQAFKKLLSLRVYLTCQRIMLFLIDYQAAIWACSVKTIWQIGIEKCDCFRRSHLYPASLSLWFFPFN